MRNSIKKSQKTSESSKSSKVDCGFYGKNDLKPKLLKRINSSGGYPNG